MTAEALKQAALDHLAANPLAAAFSVPLGGDLFVCVGTKEDIAKLVAPGWQPIDTAPKEGRAMFVVKAFNVTDKNVGVRNYTSDPWCVWPGGGLGWVRWPHHFPPTHWMPLPATPPKAKEEE